ncbi:MAG: winged helix-turn-helix domain-containing protein [Solirubrobacteraceae bacterium]
MTTPLNPNERRELSNKARTATLQALHALGGEAQRGVIREWALTHGGFTQRELEAPPPEPAIGKYRCAVDHRLSWTLTNLKREGLLENPKWSIWRMTSAGLAATATEVAEHIGPERLIGPVDPKRLDELRTMPYQRYLQSSEWNRTRKAALARAGNACSLDATHTENLEVHHRSYEHLGAELASDVLVLCHSCHLLHHKQYGRPRRERAVSPMPSTAVMRAAATSSTATEGLTVASNNPETPSRRSRLSRLLAFLMPAATLRGTRS